ncbi:MAG: pilus assembly PilX N-terminal domain-containing protein [Patescibacteria group bacterium]
MKSKNLRKIKKNRGFVILFAVTISAILLAVALGVGNIAIRELKFSTSAKDTNDAFFAADTGIECALANDKSSGSSFVSSGGQNNVQCLGESITPSESGSVWSFVLSGLGGSEQGCAKVEVNKTDSTTTIVTSKGYNIGADDPTCASSNPNRVERELRTIYGGIPNSYRYIKFTVSTTKTEPTAGCTQISEFTLLLDGSELEWNPSADATVPDWSGNPAQGPNQAIDGDLGSVGDDSKLCDQHATGATVMTLIIDTKNSPVTFNGYKYGTANDEPGRDPIKWTVEGRINDDSDWVLLDEKDDETLNIPSARNNYTNEYNFSN